MRTSEAGIQLVKVLEGLRLYAYDDGGGVLTIGFGHTYGVRHGDSITPREAEEYLKQDLLTAEKIVKRHTTEDLEQNEFDALVSFAMNVGESQYSTSTLVRRVNAGDRGDPITREFARWIYDNGRPVNGLVFRRFKEAAMFEGLTK